MKRLSIGMQGSRTNSQKWPSKHSLENFNALSRLMCLHRHPSDSMYRRHYSMQSLGSAMREKAGRGFGSIRYSEVLKQSISALFSALSAGFSTGGNGPLSTEVARVPMWTLRPAK